MRPKPPALPTPDWPPETAVEPSVRPTVLRCAACQRVEQAPAEAVRRPVDGDRPVCCGWPMLPVIPDADPDPESAADPWADRRDGERRPVRPGTRFEVRRGGEGADLAVALLDVSATGMRAAVRGRLPVGDAVVVWIAPPGKMWVYQGTAVVCWRADGAEGTAQVGLRLRSPIPAEAAADLADPDTRLCRLRSAGEARNIPRNGRAGEGTSDGSSAVTGLARNRQLMGRNDL